ncbi:hypothetical protein [Hyphomicrobium sp. CS1BSMeth3]|uniref:hypothetical protein n=1 Tax=Hyphomicrobium sp. CS1BSMeth3 TaxID=1892844 RepID=UPI000931183B|nr:hypothetical protein [Hyphomicrobium sp. CS1BSMeth3]
MATILDFPEMHVAPRRRPMRRSKAPGEVILFPGVRYERWDDAPREPEARQQTVVRDRLQLVE